MSPFPHHLFPIKVDVTFSSGLFIRWMSPFHPIFIPLERPIAIFLRLTRNRSGIVVGSPRREVFRPQLLANLLPRPHLAAVSLRKALLNVVDRFVVQLFVIEPVQGLKFCANGIVGAGIAAFSHALLKENLRLGAEDDVHGAKSSTPRVPRFKS